MPISLDSRVAIHEDAVFRELDGEAVILHLDAGMYFGLDSVGTRLWQLIEAHGSLRPVLEAALTEFDVAPDVLEHDLLDLVSALSEKRLVVVQ
jgi:coenzyme PQQ synthesis protein D (PqqD)